MRVSDGVSNRECTYGVIRCVLQHDGSCILLTPQSNSMGEHTQGYPYQPSGCCRGRPSTAGRNESNAGAEVLKLIIFTGFVSRETEMILILPRGTECMLCYVVGSRRLMPPDALQPKTYCTNPGL